MLAEVAALELSLEGGVGSLWAQEKGNVTWKFRGQG